MKVLLFTTFLAVLFNYLLLPFAIPIANLGWITFFLSILGYLFLFVVLLYLGYMLMRMVILSRPSVLAWIVSHVVIIAFCVRTIYIVWSCMPDRFGAIGTCSCIETTIFSILYSFTLLKMLRPTLESSNAILREEVLKNKDKYYPKSK